MIDIIKEILGRKQIKYYLLAISIIGFAACIIIMQMQVIDIIIDFVETNMLHRNLRIINKWKDYLFAMGYAHSVFFVIVWYFFIKKKFTISSFFLLTAFGIYLYTYKLFVFDFHNSQHYLLRFPILVLLVAIITHIYSNRKYLNHFTNINIMLINYLSQNRFLNSSFFAFVFCSLLGALFFLYIFGTAILDFTYTDWLMSGGDLSQHYLGWKFFRDSLWYFPLGLMDNIVYPFKVSIIYTDSIPLFAIIFKLLSPVLPENFQYFGLFGIICYTLQGGISALIVRKIGGNTGQAILGSSFFTLSTVMMFRIYAHTSLSAHFIILLCILVYVQNNDFNLKKQIFIWSSLLVLSVSIHSYFVPMVMIFMFFRLLQEYALSKNFKNQCIVFSVSLLVLIGTMFCLGAFYFIESAAAGGLGIYSANLNAFLNPQGMSRFIKDLPLATDGQYEGNAYLGLGIILFIATVILQLCQKKKSDLPIIEKEKGLLVLGIVLSFLLFSLSNVITINQYTLFAYPVPPPVEYLWSIFRGTGRMTWTIIYITIVFCIWYAITQFSVKKSVLFLSIFLLIQWADLEPSFVNKGNDFKTKVIWQNELSSPVWKNLANDYKHIFFMGDIDFSNLDALQKLYFFLDLAVNHKMTVNDAYLARSNQRKISDNKQKEAEYLINNGPKDDTVYIFQDEEQASLFKETGINIFIIDEVIVGIKAKYLP